MNLRLIRAIKAVLEVILGTGIWLAFFYYDLPVVGWVLLSLVCLLVFLGELVGGNKNA